ncbi:hypothetical protein MA16_Dca028667 [Dendrobium catenatum]|uniref:Transmembrane protein n=1 Tax=Dendrobium catenatum TaxID=906689 RepID=A0A2I0VE06_9ASPA|nr:hypothetical protein MA16_Dca028667 [Dendrobium catenatum]
MMMMSSRRSHTFYLVVMFIAAVIFVMSMQEAEASRLMKTTRIDQGSQVDHNSDVQEKIEKVMTMWMRKLPSGPSNRGAGH